MLKESPVVMSPDTISMMHSNAAVIADTKTSISRSVLSPIKSSMKLIFVRQAIRKIHTQPVFMQPKAKEKS